MTFLDAVMSVIGGGGFGYFTARLWRYRRKPSTPLNVVDGIVLPDPGDPRWELEQVQYVGKYGKHKEPSLVIGGICIEYRTAILYIGPHSPPILADGASEYAAEVIRQYRARLAFESLRDAQ